MDDTIGDPYVTLGVAPGASEEELRAAYRRLVQLHHPDHNGGSAESTRRFEEIQGAYARIRRLREAPSSLRESPPPLRESPPPRPSPQSGPSLNPDREARLAKMERDIREAHLARERAQQAAREAATDRPRRPSDEELGYVKTDDSFTKIFADARTELATRFSEGRRHPAVKRLADLIDELDA